MSKIIVGNSSVETGGKFDFLEFGRGVSRPSLDGEERVEEEEEEEAGRRGGSGNNRAQRETARELWGGGGVEGDYEGEKERGGGERGVILIASPWLQTASTLC